ncbi:MAG: hypothetical protein K2O18_05875 [Oscillospiraceae bacterium]|nr:hypothetical protein [Oscillospiraceae bacterium]
MNTSIHDIIIIIVIVLLRALAIALPVALAIALARYWRSRKINAGRMIPAPPGLFRQKCELEQKMASVTGGKNGLIMLLDTARHGPESDARLYRENCRAKQAELKGYLDEYDALLRQAKTLSVEEQLRFVPPEEIAQYRQLLDEKI